MFFRACSLQNEVGDPPLFLTFLTSLTRHLSINGKINVRKFLRERPLKDTLSEVKESFSLLFDKKENTPKVRKQLLNCSGPYSRTRSAKLTNHSARTESSGAFFARQVLAG